MPRYDYRCETCGAIREVTKPMAESGRDEYCARCRVEHPMARIYYGQGFIMRPSGYNLRPGDHNFSNFDREIELGEVRSPGDLPESRGATPATPPRPKIDRSSASIAAERNLRQAVEAAIVEV